MENLSVRPPETHDIPLIFTVTNDLSYDQRMQRICGTLAEQGYSVLLLGRQRAHSSPLVWRNFQQKRLRCFFDNGLLFYAEYNLRCFFFLLFARYDAVCSIDLDTLPAGCLATLLRRKKRVFDAHEYFTEVPEVVHRPVVRRVWGWIARICLPFYRHAYTVGPMLAEIFTKKYNIPFLVVRNMPLRGETVQAKKPHSSRILLYQGALNAGRGLETLLEALPALKNMTAWIIGEGDLSEALRAQAERLQLGEQVKFWGFLPPEELKKHTAEAWLSLNLLENKGLSYYYSLANKCFDSVQAGVPVVNMDFPEYRALHAQYDIGVLLSELTPQALITAIQSLEQNPAQYEILHQNCLRARENWHWEHEKAVLLKCWEAVFKEE